MSETTPAPRYTLDGKTPVPCDDVAAWQAFMDDEANTQVAFDKVGRFTVTTIFVGANIGTSEKPRFFTTKFDNGTDDTDPPIKSETWERATAKHKAAVGAAHRFTEREQSGEQPTGQRFTDVQVVADGVIRFVMESEEGAIAVIPENSKNWSREGNVLVFDVN